MNILLAPNSMKGSLTAVRFAEIMEKAFSDFNPPVFKTRKLPVADGGDGTAQVLIKALNLQTIEKEVSDPLLRPIKASFGFSGEMAIIEMASASGMKRLSNSELNPMKTSSFGTGQLILHAIRSGAKKIFLGVGGSATVDGGTGMMEALGFRFYDEKGNSLQGNGENLEKISEMDASKISIPASTEIIIISDVENPLLGESGAAQIFGPQKGASDKMVESLERGLANFEQLIYRKTNVETAQLKGAGAAGGIAIGLVAFFNAEIKMGADFILQTIDFHNHLKWADVVITGEGKLDSQSSWNKAPFVVAKYAKLSNRPVFAIVGSNKMQQQTSFNQVISLVDGSVSEEFAINNTKSLVYSKSLELAKVIFDKFVS